MTSPESPGEAGSLRARLVALPIDQQDRALEQAGPTATPAQLVQVILHPWEPQAPFLHYRLPLMLEEHGLAAVDPIEHGMRADAAPAGMTSLLGVLMDITADHPEIADRVSALLTELVTQALDRGMDSWAVATLLGSLATPSASGSTAETEDAAHRVLSLSLEESDPSPLAVGWAKGILGEAEG